MEAGASLFPATALVLGLRHGFDWDHMAAIFDIVGTARAGSREPAKLSLSALQLSLSYVLGHAAVVLALGIAAILFSAVLPDWIDCVMERVVGVTLLLFGGVMLVSLWRLQADEPIVSRTQLLIQLIRKFSSATARRDRGGDAPGVERRTATPYGSKTALSVGVFHGIGAETGTQALVLAAAAGASTQLTAVSVLVAFVIGLIASNSFITLFALTGVSHMKAARPLLVASGIAASALSLIVGTLFAAGQSSLLPQLHL